MILLGFEVHDGVIVTISRRLHFKASLSVPGPQGRQPCRPAAVGRWPARGSSAPGRRPAPSDRRIDADCLLLYSRLTHLGFSASCLRGWFLNAMPRSERAERKSSPRLGPAAARPVHEPFPFRRRSEEGAKTPTYPDPLPFFNGGRRNLSDVGAGTRVRDISMGRTQ